jgi:hypothetical protein
MPMRSAVPQSADVLTLAVEVLAAQGLSGAAARAALSSMARERGLPVSRCAALIVAAVDGRIGR